MAMAANARRFRCEACGAIEYADDRKTLEICKRCGSELKEQSR